MIVSLCTLAMSCIICVVVIRSSQERQQHLLFVQMPKTRQRSVFLTMEMLLGQQFL